MKEGHEYWSDDDLEAVVSLLHIDGVGSKTIDLIKKILIKTKTSWNEFWVSPGLVLQQLGQHRKIAQSIEKHVKENKYDAALLKLKLRDIAAVGMWSKEYPPLLKKIHDPPVVLFAQGALDALRQEMAVAVVGTRKISSYGKMVTRKLVAELVSARASIVSGGMYGVDWCAHEAALDHGGKTVAVLGYGFDYSYPAHFKKQFERYLSSQMCLVSEFVPRVAPKPGNFPSRNRIVAGMSQATVVCEAAEGSGSLITAQCALDEGRSVGVIPCAVTSPFIAGVKQLVNQGALLVTCAQDILSDSSSLLSSQKLQKVSASLSSFQASILELLRSGPADTDYILDTLTPACTLSVLLQSLQQLQDLQLIQREGDLWCLELEYGAVLPSN